MPVQKFSSFFGQSPHQKTHQNNTTGEEGESVASHTMQFNPEQQRAVGTAMDEGECSSRLQSSSGSIVPFSFYQTTALDDEQAEHQTGQISYLPYIAITLDPDSQDDLNDAADDEERLPCCDESLSPHRRGRAVSMPRLYDYSAEVENGRCAVTTSA